MHNDIDELVERHQGHILESIELSLARADCVREVHQKASFEFEVSAFQYLEP